MAEKQIEDLEIDKKMLELSIFYLKNSVKDLRLSYEATLAEREKDHREEIERLTKEVYEHELERNKALVFADKLLRDKADIEYDLKKIKEKISRNFILRRLMRDEDSN